MATHPYPAALDVWRQKLRVAFADPDAPVDFGEELVWALAAVAEFVSAERKERLRAWARDVRRWKVLPRTERERLVAAGLRHCALLANEAPVDKPAKKAQPAPARTTLEGTVSLGTPLL